MSLYDASEEASTPATPASGRQVLYPKSDGFYRKDSAGVEVKLGEVQPPVGYTVATLPTGAIGDGAYVTDATAPTYLGALTGGGAVVCPVFHNGTIWVSV